MKPLIIANWKMQVGFRESAALARALVPVMAASGGAFTLVLCPSFVNIPDVAREIARSEMALGAQDVGTLTRGARTGDVSALDLHAHGCAYCIVGHSERRTHHHESDEEVREKFLMCLKSGLIPILCVGETAEERAGGKTHAVLVRQLTSALRDIPTGPATRLIVAYEPVWSIGTLNPATPEQAREAFALILNELAEHHIPRLLATIIYGGSVNSATVREFLDHTQYEGFLVGTESQDEKRCIALLNSIRSSV